MQREFNGLGQLIIESQAHNGAVDAMTPVVQYAYSFVTSGTGPNHSRLTQMTYPNARELKYGYAAGTVDDPISRVSMLQEGPTGSETNLEIYNYLGLDTVVRRTRYQNVIVDLTYLKEATEPVGDGGDQYTGLDRFGRVVDQRWRRPVDGLHTDRFGYGYDRNGNRQYRDNLLPDSGAATFDELYHANGVVDTFDANGLLVSGAYDRLNQLSNFARGTLNGAKDTIVTGTQTRSQSWTLDAQGNWATLTTNGTPQNRTHNKQNQVTQVGTSNLTFDNNGNLKTDEFGRAYVYDAWNRLVFVGGVAVPMSYEHDALGRRIEETQVPPLPAPPVTTHVYFSDDWQVLEERVDASPHASVQYIWSDVYVDALVFRDRDTNGNPGDGMEERLYVQQDANFNVTAVTDLFGTVVERYVNDPYGSWSAYDVNWFIRGASSFAWRYQHQGNRFDINTGQYHVRNREYSPTLGRWLQRDPIEYEAGDTNLYRYEFNSAPNYTDPSGQGAAAAAAAALLPVGIVTGVGLLDFGWTLLRCGQATISLGVAFDAYLGGLLFGASVDFNFGLNLNTPTPTVSGGPSVSAGLHPAVGFGASLSPQSTVTNAANVGQLGGPFVNGGFSVGPFGFTYLESLPGSPPVTGRQYSWAWPGLGYGGGIYGGDTGTALWRWF